MNANTQRIASAITATGEVAPGYFQRTLDQRTEHPKGSRYLDTTAAQLEVQVRGADWELYTHEGIMDGCTAFKANIPGRLGMIPTAAIPTGTDCHLLDQKGTGSWSLVAPGSLGPEVPLTVLILGNEDGKEIVFTLHPGEPIPYKSVTDEVLAAANPDLLNRLQLIGETTRRIDLTLDEVLSLKLFDWAKVD